MKISSKLFFMAKTRRERYPHCGFVEVIKWSKQCGYQRYKCKKCGSLFTFRHKDISEANPFVWFEWWNLRKQTITQISKLIRYSGVNCTTRYVSFSG